MNPANSSDTDFKEYLEVLGFTQSPWARGAETQKKSRRLVFLSEAPSLLNESDPFAGADGELLSKMIQAMGLGLDEVLVKYVSGLELLREQLLTLDVDIIVTLGKSATETLLSTSEELSTLRGTLHTREQIKNKKGQLICVLPTFHPACLLREPSMKKAVWTDLQKVMKYLSDGKSAFQENIQHV